MAGTPRRIPAWIEISIHGTQEGTLRVNGFSYKWDNFATAAPTVAQLTAMATNFYTAIQAAWKNMMASTYNLDYIEARWLDPGGPLIAGQFVPTQPFPGTASGLAVPASNSCVISWRTGQLGRKFRGRTYLPALTTTQFVNSTVTAAYITAASAVATIVRDFINGGGSVGVHAVVASFVGQFLTNVTNFTIDSAIDSQRRRLINRGR